MRALRILVFTLLVGCLQPVHALAGETGPFQQWWCAPLSEKSMECTRFSLEGGNPEVLSLIVMSGGKTGLFEGADVDTARLLFRESAFLEKHELKDGSLHYALRGTAEGSATSFTVESPEHATKMRSGGTWFSYSRFPALDTLVETVNKRFEADTAAPATGILRDSRGRELFALDLEKGTVTTLYGKESEYTFMPSGLVRARTDIWESNGQKVACIMSVIVEGGIRYALELHAETNELLVTVLGSSSGYDAMKNDPVRSKLMNYISPSSPVVRTLLE